MPIVLLIRHAENDYVRTGRLAGRLPGVHLNENGQKQAQALVEKLASAPIKAIYSSPLERALETARPLADAVGLQVIQRPALLETDYGKWQGRYLKALTRLKLWRVVQAAPSRARFPQGESFAQTQYRICQEIETLCELHKPKDLFVCVSHADPIKLAAAYYLGMPLDLFQRISISPASITALHVGVSGSRLLTLNYDPSFTFRKP